jgi:hypothetical protein
MKFKNYFMIFALFFILMCSVSAISAVSNDTMQDIASEIDLDDSISLEGDEGLITVNNDEYNVNAQNDTVSQSGDDVLSESIAQDDDKLDASSKANLKIVNYTNFVKKGENFYLYLQDSKGNAVADKELKINFNGKTYSRTTDASGMFGIKVNLSDSSSSMKVSFSGDSQYNAFSQVIKFYIDDSISMTIGNSKLLTNGFLRIYLNGPKSLVSNKTVQIIIGSKTLKRTTTAEGFIVAKPSVAAGKYTVTVKYGNYVVSKVINCIKGDVKSPLKTSVPTVNGIPDIDVMPATYVMAYADGKYSLKKAQYQEVIKRDSKCLYLYGKLSKYTYFKSKDCPTIKHIIVREKWNVIERYLNTKLVKNNKYSNYWPGSITVSLNGKSYTYSEVRDIQNTEYTCGPTSASVCSQALRNYYSEKFFQKQAKVVSGVNIPVLKSAIDRNGFKSTYFYSMDSAIKQLKKGGAALIAYLPNHYVSVIDVSPDGKKILVSNSYGKYDVGGNSRIPTDWVSLKTFKAKFQGIGLVVKLNYKLSKDAKKELGYFYSNMGKNWIRQNVNERIPDVGK